MSQPIQKRINSMHARLYASELPHPKHGKPAKRAPSFAQDISNRNKEIRIQFQEIANENLNNTTPTKESSNNTEIADE